MLTLKFRIAVLSSSRKASSSWEPRNDTKSQRTTDFTQEMYWEEKARVVVASAWERSIRERSRRQGLYSVSCGQSFSGWPGIEGIVWPDLKANSGIGCGFFFFRVGPGHCPASGACEKSMDQAWLFELVSGRVWLLEPFKGSQCLAVGVPQSWHRDVEAIQGQQKPLLSPGSV